MRLSYATLLACALAASACGSDSTDPPEPEEFDPTAFQAGVSRVLDRTSIPELAIFNETTDEIADYFNGLATIASRGRIGSGPASFSVATGPFPPFLKGVTHEWSVVHERYDDGDAPGAPIAGTRFLAYNVDESGFALPLVEAGHIDLEDQGPDGIASLLAQINGATQADFTAAATGTFQEGTIHLFGYIGTGTDRVDFDIDADNIVTATGTASTYAGVFEVGGLHVEVETAVDRGPVVTYDTRLTLVASGTTVELKGNHDGEGFVGEAWVDGVQYAAITFAASADPVVTAAGGIVLTAAEQQLFGRAILLLQAPPDYIDVLLPPLVFVLQIEPGDA